MMNAYAQPACRFVALMAIGIGAGIVGCEQSTGGPTPTANPNPQPFQLFQPIQQRTTGERWTILCRRYSAAESPDHAAVAQKMADMLKAVRDLTPSAVRVETEPAGSSRDYGSYRKIESKETGRLVFPPDYQPDIELIRSLSYQQFTPFFAAQPELLTSEDIPGPGKWHISKAQGTLTLLIARFYNTGDFKQRLAAAEQYVELLRQEGLPAYYDHQTTRSFVYIGDFDESDRKPGPRGLWVFSPRVEALIAKNRQEFGFISDNGAVRTRPISSEEVLAEASQMVEVPREQNGRSSSDLWPGHGR